MCGGKRRASAAVVLIHHQCTIHGKGSRVIDGAKQVEIDAGANS